MDTGIAVEERRWRDVVPHGLRAGLYAGIVLGAAQLLISAVQREGSLTPFRLASALALGPGALRSEAPAALVIGVGGVLHLGLAALFGIVFLALLALTFQLSARAWVLAGYGLLFGFLLWEINFLALLPTLFPDLIPHFSLRNQIWKGIAAYTLIYGPALALYTMSRRPGVLCDWRE